MKPETILYLAGGAALVYFLLQQKKKQDALTAGILAPQITMTSSVPGRAISASTQTSLVGTYKPPAFYSLATQSAAPSNPFDFSSLIPGTGSTL